MAMTLTPEQQALVRQVLEHGGAASEEEAVTEALTRLRDQVAFDLEERLGLTRAEIAAALEAGRATPVAPWRGADAFNERMRKKHQDRLNGRSAE